LGFFGGVRGVFWGCFFWLALGGFFLNFWGAGRCTPNGRKQPERGRGKDSVKGLASEGDLQEKPKWGRTKGGETRQLQEFKVGGFARKKCPVLNLKQRGIKPTTLRGSTSSDKHREIPPGVTLRVHLYTKMGKEHPGSALYLLDTRGEKTDKRSERLRHFGRNKTGEGRTKGCYELPTGRGEGKGGGMGRGDSRSVLSNRGLGEGGERKPLSGEGKVRSYPVS